MSQVSIEVVDLHAKRPVDAILHTELSASQVIATEAIWGPQRIAALEKLIAAGHPRDAFPQHYHWNWCHKAAKLKFLASRCMGVEVGGELQGLMLVTMAGYVARLDPDTGKDLVYIDYIESAPSNVIPFTADPHYGGVGACLFGLLFV